jgi:hypothetical protein
VQQHRLAGHGIQAGVVQTVILLLKNKQIQNTIVHGETDVIHVILRDLVTLELPVETGVIQQGIMSIQILTIGGTGVVTVDRKKTPITLVQNAIVKKEELKVLSLKTPIITVNLTDVQIKDCKMSLSKSQIQMVIPIK